MKKIVELNEEDLEKVSGGAFGDNILAVLAQILFALDPYGYLVFAYPNDNYIISQLTQIASADLSVYPINADNEKIKELKAYLQELED